MMIGELQPEGTLRELCAPSGNSPPGNDWEFPVGRKEQSLTAMLGPSQSPAHSLPGLSRAGHTDSPVCCVFRLMTFYV